MRAQGGEKESVEDFVRKATEYYGTILKTRSHKLSKIRISAGDYQQDAKLAT